jgi:DNA-binding CsgD family transcriptional regulator
VDWTVRDVVEFAVSALDDVHTATFPAETVLGMLAPVLEAPIRSFNRLDLRARGYEAVAPDCREDDVALVVEWARSRPAENAQLAAAWRGAGMAPVTGPEVFGGGGAWRRSPLRDLLVQLGGCDQTVILPLSVDRAEACALGFARHGRDFTPAELTPLTTVQPLLQALLRHASQVARWREQLGDRCAQALAAVDDVGLTPREVTVLHLVSAGLTATAVGHRLGCSPRTVEKHVANLYRKLGVGDRVSAVLEGQRRGLLPPGGAGSPTRGATQFHPSRPARARS